mgnify:CR=1 FL=1
MKQAKTKGSTPSKQSNPFLWFVKWTSSIFLIIGMILTAYNIFPYNLYFHVVGLAGWLSVSIIWNDRSLIMLNTVALVIYAIGIISYLL